MEQLKKFNIQYKNLITKKRGLDIVRAKSAKNGTELFEKNNTDKNVICIYPFKEFLQ